MIYIVDQGVLEAAINKKSSLYQKNHTIYDVKKFLKKKKFKIIKIENIDRNIKNEKNVYFSKINLKESKSLNKKYNLRYYNRIILDKIYFKDKLLEILKKIFKF